MFGSRTASRLLKANLPGPFIRVQFPGRAGQGEQRIAQGHGAKMQVRRRQRERIQLGHGAGRFAKLVAAAFEHMPQAIAIFRSVISSSRRGTSGLLLEKSSAITTSYPAAAQAAAVCDPM